MELDLNLEDDARMDLYCDVLVRYMLVDSTIGPCELGRELGQALESGDEAMLVIALGQFESLPEELKARIMEGDPTLATTMERAQDDDADFDPRVRPASA